MIRIVLILAAGVLAFSTLSAFAAPPAKLSLKDAIKMGMDYSLPYKQSQSVVRQAHAEYTRAESAIFPTIEGIGSGKSFRSPGGYLDSGTFNPASNDEVYKAGVTLTQPLYAGGAVLSGLAAAKAHEEANSQRLYNAKQATAMSIILAYINTDEARESLEIAL